MLTKVEEYLQNAVENGYDLSGWSAEQVAIDIMDLSGWSAEQVAIDIMDCTGEFQDCTVEDLVEVITKIREKGA
jgi:hypothetical protein